MNKISLIFLITILSSCAEDSKRRAPQTHHSSQTGNTDSASNAKSNWIFTFEYKNEVYTKEIPETFYKVVNPDDGYCEFEKVICDQTILECSRNYTCYNPSGGSGGSCYICDMQSKINISKSVGSYPDENGDPVIIKLSCELL